MIKVKKLSEVDVNKEQVLSGEWYDVASIEPSVMLGENYKNLRVGERLIVALPRDALVAVRPKPDPVDDLAHLIYEHTDIVDQGRFNSSRELAEYIAEKLDISFKAPKP